MERRIRWLGIFLVLCFVALFLQLNNIQILKAHALSTSPTNPRVIAVERNDPRGDILSADGVVLASSIPSSGFYKYQRTYNPYTAVLFSQIVGYDSIIYGKTGIESQYDSYLQSHTRPAKTLGDLLTSRTTTGNVTLTIGTKLQSQVAQAVLATLAYRLASYWIPLMSGPFAYAAFKRHYRDPDLPPPVAAGTAPV